MTLYLYKVGTAVPILTIEQVVDYTADSVIAHNSAGAETIYAPLADDCELSSKANCSEALRALWREHHPDIQTRVEELEALTSLVLFGGEVE